MDAMGCDMGFKGSITRSNRAVADGNLSSNACLWSIVLNLDMSRLVMFMS